MQKKYDLSRKVHSEPTGRHLRPYLIDYIQIQIEQVQQLSAEELLHGRGDRVVASICGALAWQGANNGDEWITEQTEPVLWRLLELSGKLDANSDDIEAWNELTSVANKLTDER